MSEEEIKQLRSDLMEFPHERLVECFIKLKRMHIAACDKCDELEEELDRLRHADEMDKLIDSIDD